MLQFRKPPGFEGSAFVAPDPNGIDHLYAIVKGTFDIDGGGEVRLSETQVPLVPEPEYYDDPATSSIRIPSDVTLMKPSTDVILIGHAYAPGGRPVTWMDTSLTVGQLTQQVRVFGDRVWQSSGVGYTASTPQPFTTMPLVWERAFGGLDVVSGQPAAEPRNPVGVGYHHRKGESPIDRTPLPNLEDPRDPIGDWGHAPTPAGYGALSAHWDPRRAFAGTYDEGWEQNRAPVLPEDFDARFFNLAPSSLIAAGYLRGDERVQTVGTTPNGILQFALPGLTFDITCRIDGSDVVNPAVLDTAVIEPDGPRVVLVWRAAFECDKRALRISEISASSRPAR